MELKLDLHIHSAASPDGILKPDEIVAACRARGLNGCAICDHDVLYQGRTEYDGFLLIPGEEFSTEYGHLLGLFLQQEIQWNSFEELVSAIHAQGGLAVLAHPFEHRMDATVLEPILHLLDGVESWNSRADRKNRCANAMAQQFAQQHGLAETAGSDAHRLQEIGNAALILETEPVAETVRQAILCGNGIITGIESPGRYTALSQLVRRRREGCHSPKRWAMALLFLLKCCLEDITRRGKRTCR